MKLPGLSAVMLILYYSTAVMSAKAVLVHVLCLNRSIYHLTMLSVPHLIATKGNIVNVSSVNGMRSVSGYIRS